jgi:hypothetical protein
MNENYDHKSGISEQPLRSLYDNSEAYEKMRKECGELYDELIKTMKEAQAMYSTNSRFNYRLP